ncbi:MAG: DUF2442 domain-containing protein [Hydrogenophilales bacterium]|nr:DUF2442 domain-containing protein [Hydrogenophilales bacterium]
MTVTDKEIKAANRRGAEKKAAFPTAVSVRYDRRVSRVVITLATGLELAFSPKHAQGLEHAHPADLADAEISPSGLGIHFPRLDADIYIPALLEGFLGSKRWIAAQIGKIGGATKSEAKTAAARENGKLGVRPKKKKELATA